MATVYLARDLKHDRQVALKVLHPHLAELVGAERFLKEIKTTAHLQHQASRVARLGTPTASRPRRLPVHLSIFFALAIVYAGLGDSAKVFQSLNQAVVQHSWGLFLLGRHFAFQRYHRTPAFAYLMKRAHVK